MRRPASISRPSLGSSSVGTSSSLSRPSLLVDIRQDLEQQTTTPWKVGDTSLRPVPPFYPPLDPRCTAVINDSTPSVVASRISECLKKRSISVEYDDETITATCMTVDRSHFQINLYRGKSTKPPVNPESLEHKPDLSHAIIVEVMRTSGSVHSFHHHNRAILNAAMGRSSGVDERRCIRTSPFEFPRLERSSDQRPAKRMARSVDAPLALEHALSLLRKDRMEAQRLGMEVLVNLSDPESSGHEYAVQVGMAVVGAPMMTEDDAQIEVSASDETQSFIVRLIRDRVMPGEDQEDVFGETFASSAEDVASVNSEDSSKNSAPLLVDDAHHGGLLRSMALRVLANSLTVLAENRASLLTNVLKTSQLSSHEFVQALAEDLLGAARLPAVVSGTRLASVHEAALATRCIAILSEHCPAVKLVLANPKSDSHPSIDLLQKNCNIAHAFLVHESRNAYEVLSQDFRTC